MKSWVISLKYKIISQFRLLWFWIICLDFFLKAFLKKRWLHLHLHLHRPFHWFVIFICCWHFEKNIDLTSWKIKRAYIAIIQLVILHIIIPQLSNPDWLNIVWFYGYLYSIVGSQKNWTKWNYMSSYHSLRFFVLSFQKFIRGNNCIKSFSYNDHWQPLDIHYWR